ncbi:MAG: class I SAM-dependent methyltransferase [Archangium sp.]
MKLPLAVTVSPKNPGRYQHEAKAKAAEWDLPFFEREMKSPLEPMLAELADAFFVLGGDGWTLHDAHGSLFFSPGMAQVRLRRLAGTAQDEDTILRLCELKAGDSLVDCTLGLAADAIVCASVVGPSGRVLGIEGSKPLAILASEGLRDLSPNIEVRHGRADDVLKTLEPGSFDCVVIDPMFDEPNRASVQFEILRRFAVHEPLSLETVKLAQRVARRWVVVKGGKRGTELTRLGLPLTHVRRASPLQWARLPGGQ